MCRTLLEHLSKARNTYPSRASVFAESPGVQHTEWQFCETLGHSGSQCEELHGWRSCGPPTMFDMQQMWSDNGRTSARTCTWSGPGPAEPCLTFDRLRRSCRGPMFVVVGLGGQVHAGADKRRRTRPSRWLPKEDSLCMIPLLTTLLKAPAGHRNDT